MSVKHTVLEFPSWRPMTRYDLKRIFANSVAFHWSGNNNQICTTPTELHTAGLVSRETRKQETRLDVTTPVRPPRKVLIGIAPQ